MDEKDDDYDYDKIFSRQFVEQIVTTKYQLYRDIVKKRLQILYAGLQLGTKYVWEDAKRSKKNTFIGIFTILLVLSFIGLLNNMIHQSPIIFLKIAENEVGEFDLILTPKVGTATETIDSDDVPEVDAEEDSLLSSFSLLNATEISERLEYANSVVGASPRWTFLGKIINPDDSTLNTTVIVLVIDSDQEAEIGIGRDWDKRPLGYEEVYVSNSALRQIHVQPNRGDRLHLGIDFVGLVQAAGGIDKSVVIDALTAYITNSLQNKTLTIDPNTIAHLLGLPNVPNDQPILINGSSIPEEAIHRVVSNIIDTNWDFIKERLSPSNLYLECTVVDGVDDPYGKWPKSLGNVVILESKYLTKSMAKFVPDNLLVQDFIAQTLGLKNKTATDPDQLFNLKDYIENININEHALMVVVQYADRFKSYVKSTKGMDHDLILFTNDVAEALEIDYPVDFTLPIQQTLTGLNYLKLFLDQIFNSVLVILLSMGIVLIYSLLLSDVEDKTYEYGMLRALGLQTESLVQLLCIQGVFYSIPGIIIGLIVAQILSLPITYAMSFYSSVHLPYHLNFGTLLLCFTLGLVIPILSNIFPIKRALSNTLRDSLDVYHHSSQEVNVKIEKLQSVFGLSLDQMVISILMIVIGFIIYYVIPLTFIFLNISLFLTILNGILIAMLLGFTIVTTIFQPILERQILKLLLWGNDRLLNSLIQKSLSGHRGRNKKTALMYSICLSFIIFSGAMFTLQSSIINDNIKLGVGSDLLVLSATTKNPLQEEKMREFLEQEMSKNETDRVVLNYSFLTYPMWELPEIKHNWVSNLADYPWHRLTVYGVEEDFLNTIYNEFVIFSEETDQFEYSGLPDDPTVPNLIRSLYDDAGKQKLPLEIEYEAQHGNGSVFLPENILSSQSIGYSDGETSFYYRSVNDTYLEYLDVICSESLRYGSFIDTKSPLKMEVVARYIKQYQVSIDYLLKIRAMVTKLSGFFFSSYRQTAYGSPLLMSMDQFQMITDYAISLQRQGYSALGYSEAEIDNTIGEHPTSPLKQRLLIKLKADPSLAEREMIMNGLRNFISDSFTIVLDTIDLLSTTNVATVLLLLFFNVVAIIAATLCFFVLWLSFTANIKENSWEFGVLRAIGLSAAQVIRVYIYEALCIILAALVLGSMSGLLIAVTLTLQFDLFSEMPFHFDFPYGLFIFVVIMSAVIAVLGSFLPANEIRKKQIANVLKGNI